MDAARTGLFLDILEPAIDDRIVSVKLALDFFWAGAATPAASVAAIATAARTIPGTIPGTVTAPLVVARSAIAALAGTAAIALRSSIGRGGRRCLAGRPVSRAIPRAIPRAIGARPTVAATRRASIGVARRGRGAIAWRGRGAVAACRCGPRCRVVSGAAELRRTAAATAPAQGLAIGPQPGRGRGSARRCRGSFDGGGFARSGGRGGRWASPAARRPGAQPQGILARCPHRRGFHRNAARSFGRRGCTLARRSGVARWCGPHRMAATPSAAVPWRPTRRGLGRCFRSPALQQRCAARFQSA